jgi:hypothetical protein
MESETLIKKQQNQLMKQQSKWFAGGLAVACGLALAGSASAQSISLSGIDVSAQGGYGGWLTATFAAGAPVGSAGTAGIEVTAPVSGGFGGTYFDLGGGAVTLDADSTQVTLMFTVNGNASDYTWLGVPLDLNDGTGATYPGVYSGSGNPGNPANAVWVGNTASITYDLNATQLTAIQTGSDVLYGFNVGVDPAVITAANIDLTFNSLTFHPTPTPEPGTLALACLGGASLLLFRRRK